MGTKAYTIGDLHLGHEACATRRGFSSIQEHDAYIIEMINATVNPTDSLILVGDVLITSVGLPALYKIHCRHQILVPGNHDGERCKIPTDHFTHVTGAYARRLPGSRTSAVFTHIPIHPSCLDRWDMNIHGHLHDESIIDPRYVCVSCEQLKYKPIALEDILK